MNDLFILDNYFQGEIFLNENLVSLELFFFFFFVIKKLFK